jgi:hypothetical protein
MAESEINVLEHKHSTPDPVNHKSRQLRILCLNYEFPPMGGGAGNATRQTAIELGKMGHTVHVLTGRVPGQDNDKNCVAGVDSRVTMPKTAEYRQK